jgi:hypothetical protein
VIDKKIHAKDDFFWCEMDFQGYKLTTITSFKSYIHILGKFQCTSLIKSSFNDALYI